ncbi:putative ribonuclease H-like domain-containing protein, partial [Tanacetum coccineum]
METLTPSHKFFENNTRKFAFNILGSSFDPPDALGFGRDPPAAASKNVREATCKYHQREMMVSGNNYTRVNYNYIHRKTHPNAHRNMVPGAVLMKSGLRPLNTARPIHTAYPKTTVYSARPKSYFSKTSQSTVRRPIQMKTTLTNRNINQKVNTVKGKVNTAKTKAVNTATPNSAVVNDVRENLANVVKASAYWEHPPNEDQGYVDSGCSRHMTGNTSYLTDFKEFNGGYVAFEGGAKGGRITVPRKNNMYSVDMKNIVPKESLTCFVAKATLDESMLWHKRLGHINFKNINKLVKENLVRGLPTKRFENDQTCVACLKEKQHRAL